MVPVCLLLHFYTRKILVKDTHIQARVFINFLNRSFDFRLTTFAMWTETRVQYVSCKNDLPPTSLYVEYDHVTVNILPDSV